MAWRSTVLLSALQLHRKTIKFQKPDTTQGGIIFKARCCLLFSVLNKILRVGTSGWFIMNRDSVHMICRPSPWREGLLFTGYLTRRFLASSADAQSWPVKYCAASSHSRSLHAPKGIAAVSLCSRSLCCTAEDRKELRIPFDKPNNPADRSQPALDTSVIPHDTDWK